MPAGTPFFRIAGVKISFLMDFNSILFFLFGALFIAYAVLDGFDLGIGILLPAFRDDDERRRALRAAGPVWDGNEIWLLAAGGALFAAFPHAFASVSVGFRSVLILVLGALISRAIARGARNKSESRAWRERWDKIFSACSVLVALFLGIGAGNLVTGVPVNAAGEIDAETLGLLNFLEPIPLLSGVLALALFALHGALFLRMKTGDVMRFKIDLLLPRLFAFAAIFHIALTAFVIFGKARPGAANYESVSALGIVPVLAIFALVATGFFLRCRTFKLAFCGTTATIALLVLTVACGMFPNLVPALGDGANSLTIRDSAPPQTLATTLAAVCLGALLLVLYRVLVCRAFAKKNF